MQMKKKVSIVIINKGETRGDQLAFLKIDDFGKEVFQGLSEISKNEKNNISNS